MIDTTTYEKRLRDEKKRLEDELKTVAQPNPSNPTEWEGVQKDITQEADPSDQADLLDQYQENRALTDVLNARYQEVNAALERIKGDSYGICEVGGEEIEEERLEADPAAQTCKKHLSS